ncbi:hypothetical protein GGQ08_001881 [Salinibacter ruber]|nr:hypothetical protein [Salinibacter ruber]MCS3653841.1 hypothetical protein [Salinibacter ruber]
MSLPDRVLLCSSVNVFNMIEMYVNSAEIKTSKNVYFIFLLLE